MRNWWGVLNENERAYLREHVGKNWYDLSATQIVRELIDKKGVKPGANKQTADVHGDGGSSG